MKYYLDTSIWLDLFEDRNESNLQKSKFAHELMKKLIKENDKIIFTELISIELMNSGYAEPEIKELLNKFDKLIINIEPSNKEIGKSKDLASKRDVPRGDALHSLIARNNKAILVTRDNHFKRLIDIIKSKKPEEII